MPRPVIEDRAEFERPQARAKLEQTSRSEDLKEQALFATLAAWPALIVAYSGGVDSAYLAWAATRVLGRAGALHHRRQPQLSRAPSRPRAADRPEFGFAHEIIHTNEMERPEYRANPANRCYYCKHELYTHLSAIARAARHSRRSPTAATPTIVATIVPAARPRGNSASSVRSTRSA